MRDHTNRGGETEQKIDRRTFLGVAGSTLIGAAAAGTATAATDSIGVVSTRDHFSTTWYREVQRNDSYGPAEYQTEGTVAGLQSDDEPDEVVVFVHGWLDKSPADDGTFETFEQALTAEGYDAPVVGYSWDADTWLTRWWQATEIAELNGPKLAAFLEDLTAESPETSVRLVGHSLGGRLVLSALQAYEGTAVDSVSLLGAAVNADDIAVGGEYGETIADGTAAVDNFWYEDDAILEYAYSLAEWDSAVGQVGSDGEQPATYTDHKVDVGSHGEFYEADGGCIDEVVETFEG